MIAEGYQPEERDFRSTLVRARDANPDGFALLSYAPDGALIARPVRQVGLKQPIVAASSVYSPRFIELGGEAVEGVHTGSRYFPEDPRPEVREFINELQGEIQRHEPDAFNAYAYDAINFAVAAIRHGGTDRRAIRDALGQLKDVPSVIFGKATFDTETRRILGAKNAELVVKDGRFQVWDGKKAADADEVLVRPHHQRPDRRQHLRADRGGPGADLRRQPPDQFCARLGLRGRRLCRLGRGIASAHAAAGHDGAGGPRLARWSAC